jgi:putative transcriptional regulator
MRLGERVAEIRRAHKISQERLALKAGLRRETITRLERGDQAGVQLATAVKIARAFGMTVDELLKDVDIDFEPAVASASPCD